MDCEVCKGTGTIVDGRKWKECEVCLGTGEKPTPEECKKGNHNHCQDVIFEGTTYVVCHDCKRTLGRKTEVYSRVVGYLRPVSQWNEGKQAEFKERKTYNVGGTGLDST